MSNSGVNFSGLSSGIDTEGIIASITKLSQRPVQLMQQRQTQIRQQQAAINQITALVTGLQGAASTLSAPRNFNVVTASASDESVADITVTAGAATGNHNLTVTQLAQAQRLGSATFSSSNTAFGVAGQFVINGKAVTVQSSDSLEAISTKINSANAGVDAAIVTTAPGAMRLIISSKQTGTANKISMSDVGSGTILQSTLGIISAGSTTNSSGALAVSNLFGDSANSIGTLLGLTSPPSGSVQINGSAVSLDLGVDSLAAVALKINNASISGVTAQVVSVTDPASSTTKQQLQITGATTFTDSSGILKNIGVLQSTPTNELVTSRDAQFTLNGLSMTRSSNTVTDALSNVSITLKKETGAPSTTLNVRADTDLIKNNVKGLVSQYNQLKNTMDDLSSFDPATGRTGPLFGDITIRTVVDDITAALTGSITGLTGSVSLAANIGITLDGQGNLNLNENTLSQALNNNLAEVSKIFMATGSASDSRLTYIAAGDKASPSSSTGYAVNVTQAATQAQVTTSTDRTANDNSATEVLTFTGGQFGATGRTVLLSPNSTLDGIISQINGDTNVGSIITASKVLSGANYRLQLTAKQFGSGNSFTVTSSQAAAANNSGVGSAGLTGTGLNVMGTINGEATTGTGQFMLGSSGNATTDGLQIRVNTTTTGLIGNLIFTRGIGDQINRIGKNATDFISGTLSEYASSLNAQVDDISDNIADLNARIASQAASLRQRFSAMEDTLARIKSSGAGLSRLGINTQTSTGTQNNG